MICIIGVIILKLLSLTPKGYNLSAMYADVVVSTYQSPEIDSYTYEVPESLEENLKIGQLVRVPFGTRTEFGIVIEIKKQKPQGIKIRPLISLPLKFPLLLPLQIKLLKWLSFYYHAPMANCLEAMLPDIPTKVERLTTNATAKNSFSRSSLSVSQTLVLVPTINRLPETLAKFPRAKNYVLYHNQLKTSERFGAWLKILSGGPDYIFGSRSAIFSPCPKLSKIIIFDEHDRTYKDERSPYFDTLTVAEKLSEITSAKIQIYDSSPKITTYFSHSTEVQIPKVTKNQLKVKIISMEEERKAGNKLPLSEILISLLRQTHQKGGRSLLFLNKKIQSGQIYCKNCHHQTFTSAKPQVCPHCNSQDIWFYSLNIATLANTVKQVIPQASIRLIAEGHKLPTTNYQLPTIDIATSTIFYTQIFQKYDLTCHVSTDSILNTPDFTTVEKAFSQITDLKKLTKENGTLLLQTFKPENPLIQTAALGNWQAFYKSHLAERKMLSYPPFAQLIKLTIRGKNSQKNSQAAQNLALKLKERSISIDSDIFVLGPYQPVFSSKIPRYNIILKKKLDSYSLKSREKATDETGDLLNLAGRQWQITIEPDSLN